MKPYYNQSAEKVRMQINGTASPLTNEQVRQNQQKYGFNEQKERKKVLCRFFWSSLRIFL